MSERCTTCRAPIEWVFTSSGRRMPLDKEPSPNGNVWIDSEGTGQVVSKKRPAPEGEQLRTSHFQTCKQAASHRRR